MSYPDKVLLGVLLENRYFKECLKQFLEQKRAVKVAKTQKLKYLARTK